MEKNATIDSLLTELVEISSAIVSLKESVAKSQKEAEALLARESRYQAILEILPFKIFLKEKNLVYVFSNEKFAQSLKMKAAEILGKSDRDLFPTEIAEAYIRDDQGILTTGQAETVEIKERADGEERFELLMKFPLRDAQGRSLGILGVIQDITEEKRVKKEAEEFRARLKELELEAAERKKIEETLDQARKEIDEFWVRLRDLEAAHTSELEALQKKLEQEAAERKKIEETLRQTEEASDRLIQDNAFLEDIEKIIVSARSEEEVYERSAAEIVKKIPFEAMSITAIREENLLFTPVFCLGPEIPDYRPGEALPLSQTIEEEVLKARSSLLIQKNNPEDVLSRFSVLLPFFKAGFQSMLVIPLMKEGQVAGGFMLLSTRQNAFDPEHRKLAEKVGIKLARVRQDSEYKKKVENLSRDQAEFRMFIDSNPLAVCKLGLEGTILEANPALCRMIGYSAEDLRQKSFFSLLIPDDLSKLRDHLERAGGGEPQKFEISLLPKECRPQVEVEMSLVPTGVEGKVLGVYALAKDITEQKRLMKMRESFQQKYGYMVDHVPMGMWVYGQGEFKFVNPLGAEVLGYSREEFLLKSLAELIHPDDEKRVIESYSRWMSGEKPPETFTARFFHKNGEVKWLQHKISLIPWEKKEVVLTYILDITQRVRAREEFRSTAEQMQALLHAIEEMIDGGNRQ